jgi:hypothetical protein
VADAEPIGVHVDAENASELERTLVAGADRLAPKYAGYSLFITTEDLNRHFRLVESAAQAATADDAKPGGDP